MLRNKVTKKNTIDHTVETILKSINKIIYRNKIHTPKRV